MSMQQLILSFGGRADVLELPWPLQEHSLTSEHNTYTFNTINQGEVLAIGRKKLKTMTINSVFPAHKYPFLFSKDFPSPIECVDKINKWKLTNKPIRVIIVDTDINLAMAIESFQHGKADGDGSGDVEFTLSLKEYSYLNVERSKVPDRTSGLLDRPDERIKENDSKKYTIKQGDTLWDLADKNYGDGSRWKEIAKANKITDPRKLMIGQNIVIPAKEGI